MATVTSGFRVKIDGAVARVTLDRPERRNALSHELNLELDHELREIGLDSHVRVIVLAAAGPVFCSGHDLSELVDCSEERYAAIFIACTRLMRRLRAVPQPVITRVQGPALAAGCQLVAACDLAVATTEATFSTPGVNIGLFCTTPMVPLVRAIAPKPALEMLLTGAPITAQRALELGLVNRVVPAEQLDTAVESLTAAILGASPAAVRLGKAEFYAQIEMDEAHAYQRATEVMTRSALCDDAQEGIAAFMQKRRPAWPGGEGVTR
jgi:enoyl-CoA hydratase/carnithine racemase